jgi:hypothetical protein
VDIKELIKSDKEKSPLKPAGTLPPDKKLFIRTMEKDLAALQKKGPTKPVRPMTGLIRGEPPKKAVPPSPAEPLKKAVPPTGLPVFEPAKKPEMPSPPLAARPTPPIGPPQPTERLRKEEEIKKRIEETRKRIEEARRKAVARGKMEKGKRPKEVRKEIEKFRKPGVVKKKKTLLRFVLISLAAVVVIGGLGGFIYWWNYLRVVTPVFHYECQDNLCLQVEGEGEDQCQTDVDCQPVEPTIPASLVPVAETKTIELATGQEDLLVEVLKTAASQAQATSTFKQILVKLVSQTEKKYADLNALLTALGVSLPDSILTAVAAGETEGDNYTLFLYNQAEGNRLGLIIETAQSETLVADLKNWETTIVEDIKPFFLEDEVPAAFTEGFQDNIYQDVAIRYLNFPDPGLSIDYGIVTDKLVLSTSRKSMYAAIDALLAAESKPAAETELEDCGLSESLLTSSLDQINPEADSTLVCLGQNILNGCQESKAVLKTSNAGEINYVVEGQIEEGICRIRLEYGDEEQIPVSEQKQYANTYLKCPVDLDLIKAQAPEKDPAIEPGAFTLSVYVYIGFESLSPDTACEIGNLD